MDRKTFKGIIDKIETVVNEVRMAGHESVCICGSSRFCDLIAVVKWRLEGVGIPATGLHLLPDWYWVGMNHMSGGHGAEQEGVSKIMDELHLEKIRQSGAVLIVNPNNYIGERTRFEIEYAKNLNKHIYYYKKQLIKRKP